MMPDQGQSSSGKGKTQTKAAIDNKKKLDFPLDFSFKDLGDVSGKFHFFCTRFYVNNIDPQTFFMNGQ